MDLKPRILFERGLNQHNEGGAIVGWGGPSGPNFLFMLNSTLIIMPLCWYRDAVQGLREVEGAVGQPGVGRACLQRDPNVFGYAHERLRLFESK